MSLPQSVPEVIEALEGILKGAEATNSRLGLFPALYRKVTQRVLEGIQQGRFQDGQRMAQLDVVFANRYLAAYQAYSTHQACSACWKVSFDAAQRWRPTVLQHLLLGMAAHIQFDLGIAAASVAPGFALPSLKPDFMAINDVLGELIAEVEASLDRISPWMGVLDVLSGDLDRKLAAFGMNEVRDGAWRFAESLSIRPQSEWGPLLKEADTRVAEWARVIASPGPLLASALLVVRVGERMSPKEAIQTLA